MARRLWLSFKSWRNRQRSTLARSDLEDVPSEYPKGEGETATHELPPLPPTLVFTSDSNDTESLPVGSGTPDSTDSEMPVTTAPHQSNHINRKPGLDTLHVSGAGLKHGSPISGRGQGHPRPSSALSRQTTMTSLQEEGYSSDENVRPRVGSDISAASSYKTCRSAAASPTNLHHSPNSARLRDGVLHCTMTKDEMLKLMKEAFEGKINDLERKIDSGQKRIEARVEEIERKLQIQMEELTESSPAEERRAIELPTDLPVLTEDSEKDAISNDSSCSSSQLTQGSVVKTSSKKARRYTDTVAVDMKRNREAMQRRQQYGSTKSVSLQHYSQVPNKPCDQKVVMWLTQNVTNWKFLARWLGLQEADVARIETDNPNNNREQCYQMFLRLRAVDPENYTYPVLGEALRKESQELYSDYVKEVHRVENKI